jgi:enoyl-CoA hydratase/carnithine racemase
LSENIDIEVGEAVMTITLNRPDKLNAITPEMNAALFDAFATARRDDSVHAIRLRGAGRAFSAGADLGMASQGGSARQNAPADMVQNRERVQGLLNLWAFPKPVIAEVHGYCLGIATEIVACADVVLCAAGARIGMPETRDIALPPTLAFWPATIGVARTKDLLFTGRLLDGHEAVAAGLAARVVEDDELEAAGLELARHVAEVPIHRLAVIKQAVNSWVEDTWVPAALRGAEYHALYHQASEAISEGPD